MTGVQTCALPIYRYRHRVDRERLHPQQRIEVDHRRCQRLAGHVPFRLRVFDSDNGSEFINHAVADWLQTRDIEQTRPRPSRPSVGLLPHPNPAKRLELKKALVDPAGTDESREAARLGLQKLPRNASPIRVRGRDSIDGRPRGFLSKYGVSRVRFRDMAHRGELPGITKSSW